MMSHEALQSAISRRLAETFGADSGGAPLYGIVATFDDYVIVQGPEARLFQVPFTPVNAGADETDDDIDEDGEADRMPGDDVPSNDVRLGVPRPVSAAYVPVSQAAHFVAGAEGGDPWSFPVQVMEAGWARGTVGDAPGPLPHYFPVEVVAQVAQAVNGARFGRRHPETGDGADQPERIAGWLDGGRMSGNAAMGTVHLLQSENGLQAKLAAARAAGKLDLFGVSVLGYFAFKPGRMEGKPCLVAGGLGKLMSVDLCAEAGAGGKFLPYAASRAVRSEIARMQSRAREPEESNPRKNHRTGGASGARPPQGGPMHEKTNREATGKDHILKVTEALRVHDAPAGQPPGDESDPALHQPGAGAPRGTNADSAALVRQAQAALDEARKTQALTLMEARLADAHLPASAARLVREHLRGQAASEAEIDAEIQRVRDAFTVYANAGGAGGARVGLETVDKVQLAMDALLGIREARKDANAHAFRGVKDAYMFITGDRDLRFGRHSQGGFTRVAEAISSADFPNILLNSMTKKLLQDYAEVGMAGLDLLITSASLADYKQQDRVREGYFGDLPVVGEAQPYLELAKPTDERISYTPSKHGGLLTVSEETIRNDDLGGIARFPSHLARAGRHTLKSYVTNNFFVNNPAYAPDGAAWFSSGHNNLGSNPFGVDALVNAEVALMKQQEKDSGNRLGFRIQWIMVPVDLAAQAWQVNSSPTYNPGPGVQQANPFYQRFGPLGPNGEAPKGIIVNELLAAPHNWYYGVWPSNIPFLEIGYLDGVEEPQIFLAGLATQGALFTNDQIQYKAKFVFGGAITDFRPVGMNLCP